MLDLRRQGENQLNIDYFRLLDCWKLKCYSLWPKHLHEGLLCIRKRLYYKSCVEDHHTLNWTLTEALGCKLMEIRQISTIMYE